MGLFGRDKDENEATPPPEDEPEAQTEGASEGDASTEETPEMPDGEELEDAELEPHDEGEEASSSESDIDVEDALKELSARMAVLSSNLEGVQESRTQLEDKLGSAEQRMSRLGSLAEAVSSEYNPFISENAPDEPSWTPEPEGTEDGAQPPTSTPSSGDEASLQAEEVAPPDPPSGSDLPQGAEPDDGRAPEAAERIPEDDVDTPASGPNGEGPADGQDPEPVAPEAGQLPRTDPERLEPTGAEPSEDGMSRSTHDGELEESLLMLEWVGMMLDRVGRAGLMDLLDYYQTLGWLDRDVKETATRVAVGVDAPDRVGDSNWRGDVDLHRRSLVAIQRLEGHEVPAARLDELQLDLRRLFGE